MLYIEKSGLLGDILESVQIQFLTWYLDIGLPLHRRKNKSSMQQCYILHSHQFRADIAFVISIYNANFSTEVPFFLLKLFDAVRLDTVRINKTLGL